MAQQKAVSGTAAATRQPQDPYGRQAKTLTGQVQRLRGWLGSDPSKLADFTDALLALDEHRLLGHRYSAAGPDAQEAVRRSVELLLAGGPVGPYTQAPDAVRCGVAFLQLAAVQVGLGLPSAAGRTLGSWRQLHEQFVPHRLDLRMPAVAVVHGLHAEARAALDEGDPARANGWADRAAALLPAIPPAALEGGFLELDIDLLLADSRWAAGRVEESLGLLHRARDRHEALTGGRFDQPGRYPVPLLERLAEPLFSLRRDLADRLRWSSETDLGLDTRRRLVDLLRALAPRLGEPWAGQLTAALTDLADDLLAAGRLEEAVPVAGEAVERAEDKAAAGAPRLLAAAVWARVLTASGEPEAATELLATVRRAEAPAAGDLVVQYVERVLDACSGRALTDADRIGLEQCRTVARGVLVRGAEINWPPAEPGGAFAAVLPEDIPAGGLSPEAAQPPEETEDWLRTERERAHRVEEERLALARAEADARRRVDEEAARVAAELEARQRVEAAEQAQRVEREQAAAEEAERQERRRRREERLREHQDELDRRAAEERATRRAELEDRIARLTADAVGAESSELDRLRLELAALAAEDSASADTPDSRPDAATDVGPAPGATVGPGSESPATADAPVGAPAVEPADAGAAASLEPAASPVAEPTVQPAAQSGQPIEPARPTEPQDEVEAARQRWHELRAAGDRRAARAELEQLVELLRRRTGTDFTGWALPLITALDDLATARLRGGDLFGSRAAARESKAVSRRIGIG